MSKLSVCFVCLGNICRSPTAEAVFARMVANEGLVSRFTIDSAGTGGWHAGERAHPETRAEASRRGVEITHRARQWKQQDFARFDYVIVMDTQNLADVLRLAPDETARAKVRLFRDFETDAGEGAEVPDPYHTGGFGHVFEICERASAGLLAYIRQAHAL